METVNITDPEELEAHLEVRDVKERIRKQQSKAMLLCGVIVVCVAAAVAVSFIIGERNQDQAEQEKSNINANTLPDPSSDLALKCSMAQITTQGGYQVCESLCEVSECCTIPQDFALSCQLGNEQVCQEYRQYCLILDQISDPNNNNIDMEDNIVLPVKDEQGTNAKLKQVIDGACEGLTANSVEGTQCESLCQVAACCREDTAEDCGNDFCQVYSSCQVVLPLTTTTEPPTQGIEPIADTDAKLKQVIDEACQGLTANWVQGTECESLCQVATCCREDTEEYCGSDFCQVYSSCQVVFPLTTTTPTPPTPPPTQGIDPITNTNAKLKQVIDDACQGLTANGVTGTECESLCQVATCCRDDTDGSCGTDFCQVYNSCQVVFDTTSIYVPTKEDVDDACSNHLQNSVGGQQSTLCEQLCQDDQVGPCCFGQTGGISCSSSALVDPASVYCQMYASCSVVFVPATVSNPSPPQPSPNLPEVCANPAQRPTCIDQCSEATCCHATTALGTCNHVHPGINCEDFSPCNILY
jgi:hypothetical protein